MNQSVKENQHTDQSEPIAPEGEVHIWQNDKIDKKDNIRCGETEKGHRAPEQKVDTRFPVTGDQ
jgi:hypothetical protein